MGKVSGNWITGTHSGRACHHEDIYTKVNKKTGACYSVKLCNPNTEWTEGQTSQRSEFGAISSAISAWINTNKVATAANYADYQKVKKQYDRQTKYATLRGMMYAKGMYTIASDGTVTVDITANTVHTSSSSSGGSSNSGGTTTTKYTVSLAASPSNGGTVSGAGSYTAGSTANISAVANSGYTFSQWSDGNTSASRSVTVNSALNLTAVFTAVTTPSEDGGEGDGDEENPNGTI